MKDLSQSLKQSIIFNEEKITKHRKELETVLKDKKCKNCPICLEGMNHSFKDQIDLITDLNKKLMEKSNDNDNLLEQNNLSSKLLAEVTSHNFSMLRQKTQDFLKSHDQLKQKQERKVMQVEDQLTLEAAKYNEIIKTRVRQLQDKIDAQQAKISSLTKDCESYKTQLKDS